MKLSKFFSKPKVPLVENELSETNFLFYPRDSKFSFMSHKLLSYPKVSGFFTLASRIDKLTTINLREQIIVIGECNKQRLCKEIE